MTSRCLSIALFLMSTVSFSGFPCQAQDSTPAIGFGDRSQTGKFDLNEIDESSGLVASHNFPNHFWTHNDDGAGRLFLVNDRGQCRAIVDLPTIQFRDPEDIAMAAAPEGDRDSTPFLVVADTGDNRRVYPTVKLHRLKEPSMALPKPGVDPVRHSVDQVDTIEFTYPEGPRDCEAAAIDPATGKLFLISKRLGIKVNEPGATIHWLSWPTEASTEKPSARRLQSTFAPDRVTGMDISSDGRTAVVRSYTMAWLFHRDENESWSQRFSTKADSVHFLPMQRQGEAICFSRDGQHLWLTSEGTGQAMWKIELKPEDSRR